MASISPQGNICNVCNNSITGKIISALGKTWHPEHFACAECSTPITGDKFNQIDSKPWCANCYAAKHLKTCRACNKPIHEKVIIALGANWHENHFVCVVCKKPMSGESFYEKEGMPYCQKDYQEKFSSKCSGCKQLITDGAIIALDGKWHQHCFTCVKCNLPVVESSFHVQNNRPLCSKCAA